MVAEAWGLSGDGILSDGTGSIPNLRSRFPIARGIRRVKLVRTTNGNRVRDTPLACRRRSATVLRAIADEVGAYLLADIAHIAGLVATGHHPNPLPYCDVVTTTTHKTLRGPRGGLIMTKDAELGKKLDKSVFPGTQGGPLEHVIAAKAVAFGEALKPAFKAYSGQVIANAQALAAQLQKRGFKIVSGGTDNHLMLVDLRSIGMTGKVADQLMGEIHVTANKNTVPFDPESPFVTSGLRLGSPAMTTRGLEETDFAEIGDIIADCLLNPDDKAVKQACLQRVTDLCKRFPLYPHLKIPVGAAI